jgi:hypothetical protein
MKANGRRLFARALATLWALWWVFFAFASTLAEGKGFWSVVVPTGIVLMVFGGCAAMAWTKERLGGTVLLLVGAVLLYASVFWMHHTRIDTKLFVVGTLALPPLLTGTLLLHLHPKPGPSHA